MAERRLSDAELHRRLERCRAEYEAIKAKVADVGFICVGSLVELYHCCGNPNCRCADPQRRHGPYHQLTWKQAGKTVTRRLSAEEARLYRQWIANRRRLESLIDQMQRLSRRAGDYLLSDMGRPVQGPDLPRRRRRSGTRPST